MAFKKSKPEPPQWVRAAEVRDDDKPKPDAPDKPVYVEYLRSHANYNRGEFRRYDRMTQEIIDLQVPTPQYEHERPFGTDRDPLDRGELRHLGDFPM